MEVYRCYSNSLKEHLMGSGLRYLVIARDIKTNAVFWLFEYTDKCKKLIEEWEFNSPRK